MKINLNKNELTIESVQKLIASKDDSEHRQIRVTKNGIVYISDIIGNQQTEDLLFRLETYQAGNDYLGLKASKDLNWVRQVYHQLKNNWPNPQCSLIDF